MKRSAFTLFAAACSLVWTTSSSLAADGPKFSLSNGMSIGQDPDNPSNEVATVTTSPGLYGGVMSRQLIAHAQIPELTNQLSLKYLFTSPKSCSSGTFFLLHVTVRGVTFPLIGYFGNTSGGGGCPSGVWTFADLANLHDTTKRWDLSNFTIKPAATCNAACSWSDVVNYFAAFQGHKVQDVLMVDNNCLTSSSNSVCGASYYDVVTMGDRTFDSSNDTVMTP